MEFGLFLEFGVRNGRAAGDSFREGFALAELAERLGMHSVWLAEFHFMPDRSVLSSPIAVAGRARRAHPGASASAWRSMCCRSPIRCAWRRTVATVDQISGGRFDFGVGRSGFVAQYRGLRHRLWRERGPLRRGARGAARRLRRRAVLL